MKLRTRQCACVGKVLDCPTHVKLRTRQSGLSLLELSIALVIASVFVVLQFQKSNDQLRLAFLDKESTWVAKTLHDIETDYQREHDYSTLSVKTLGAMNSVPASYIERGPVRTVVVNGFDGRVYVIPMKLGTDASFKSYALTYTNIPDYSCARMVVLLTKSTKAGSVPLYGLVADTGSIDGVPLTISLNGSQHVEASGLNQVVLQRDPSEGLDMSKVGTVCKSAKTVHLTLIRRP